ncbi:MAG: hypothetical protein JSS66_16875 [Armatimonadetes bacterium]|nr:hypothetical protein [Armatimonadota bacterium]
MSLSPVLNLENLVLAAGGRALSLELFAGEGYAVMGPSGSAKQGLINAVCEREKPASGAIGRQAQVVAALERDYSRRDTPQSLAKKYSRRVSGAKMTDVLTALGLWEMRQAPTMTMEPALAAACDLIPLLLDDSPIGVIDGQLDALDPWAREATLDVMEADLKAGRAFLVKTNLTTIAARLGNLVVFRGDSPVFAGPVATLLRSVARTEVWIETDDPTTVSTMVEPFTVSVRILEGGVLIEADKGQEIAARLLTIGYGKVKSLVIKEPTVADALRQLY